MNIQKLNVLLGDSVRYDSDDNIDFVFLPGEEKSRILMDCYDCSYCGCTVGDTRNHVITYSNVYCSNAQRVIHTYDIPIESFFPRNKRPHIPIPKWCPLRTLTVTHIPLSTKDATFAKALVYGVASLGRHVALRPVSAGLALVIEGELTSDIKELLVEILI